MTASQMMRRRKRAARGGFTLMEVLLVLAILVVLGSVATYFYQGAQDRANINVTQTQMNVLKQSLIDYRTTMQTFPSQTQGLQALISRPNDLRNVNRWKGPYLDAVEVPRDAWDNEFVYESSPSSFRIISGGPDGSVGTADDIIVESLGG